VNGESDGGNDEAPKNSFKGNKENDKASDSKKLKRMNTETKEKSGKLKRSLSVTKAKDLPSSLPVEDSSPILRHTAQPTI
jgi:hypothetical protein